MRLQVGERQSLLEDEGGRQEERPRAADRQVVDGAVHGQAADVAAGEEERTDHERVGREGDPRRLARVAGASDRGLILEGARTSLPKPGTNIRWIRSAVNWPPLPWPSRIWSYRETGNGHVPSMLTPEERWPLPMLDHVLRAAGPLVHRSAAASGRGTLASRCLP